MRRWATFAFVLSACSLLADTDTLVIKCEVAHGRQSDDPCLASGMHCVASECKPCEDAIEICNGVDDDCDGVVDNGHDDDNDGFTWCGGGRSELADCVDADPKIHPGGMVGPDGSMVRPPQELCDGKDNDCDSKVDEAAECSAMHSCVRDGCPSPQRCDSATGVCIEPRPVGSGCQSDSECAGGFCARKGDYGLSVELSDNRCASACCSDADCANGSVCVASDSGARLCLPVNIAARASRALGERCGDDHECASGTCDYGRCTQRCTSDAICKGGSVCVLSSGTLNEGRRWLCGEAFGREAGGAACTSFDPTACRSGFCTERGCAKPCGRKADCGSEENCSTVNIRALLVQPMSTVSMCTGRGISDSAALCCTNADCAKGELCAPKAGDNRSWSMVCK